MNRLFLASILILSPILLDEARGNTVIWAPAPLAQIIEEGVAQNQDLQSLKARLEEFEELVPFAGSLEDPRLGIALLNLPTDTFDFDQEPMTQKQFFIAQKVPWFGKLDLRSKSQRLVAVRQAALLEAKKLELARKIATTYYQLGLTGKSLEVNGRLAGLVGQLLRVAETRYASGMGLQQDVLRAQVELSKLLEEQLVLEKKRRTLEDRINELLNRESFSPVTPPDSPAYPDLTLEVQALKEQALKGNPWLNVRLADEDRAAVGIELAEKDYWPDMDFKLAYGQRDDTKAGVDRADFLSGSVVFKIPLWQKNRQDKKLRASQKRHEAAAKSYRSLMNTLPHRVDALVAEIENMQKNYRLTVDEIMVQAQQWAQSSLAAYKVGKVEFNTMITAQIRLLRFELQAERYLFGVYQKRAELEETLGGPMEEESLTGETDAVRGKRPVRGDDVMTARTQEAPEGLPRRGEGI